MPTTLAAARPRRPRGSALRTTTTAGASRMAHAGWCPSHAAGRVVGCAARVDSACRAARTRAPGRTHQCVLQADRGSAWGRPSALTAAARTALSHPFASGRRRAGTAASRAACARSSGRAAASARSSAAPRSTRHAPVTTLELSQHVRTTSALPQRTHSRRTRGPCHPAAAAQCHPAAVRGGALTFAFPSSLSPDPPCEYRLLR